MTFRIEADNKITAFPSPQQLTSGGVGETFTNAQELATLAAKWPAARLLEIWNGLPGIEPVQRFASRLVATARIWKAVQRLVPVADATQMKHAARKKSSGGKKGGFQQRGRPAARAKQLALSRCCGDRKGLHSRPLCERPAGKPIAYAVSSVVS